MAKLDISDMGQTILAGLIWMAIEKLVDTVVAKLKTSQRSLDDKFGILNRVGSQKTLSKTF